MFFTKIIGLKNLIWHNNWLLLQHLWWAIQGHDGPLVSTLFVTTGCGFIKNKQLSQRWSTWLLKKPTKLTNKNCLLSQWASNILLTKAMLFHLFRKKNGLQRFFCHIFKFMNMVGHLSGTLKYNLNRYAHCLVWQNISINF